MSSPSANLDQYLPPLCTPSSVRPLLTGTCGWTDETLSRCGRFYPRSALASATERLRHYSRVFPCVEVDTSTYAIPRADQVREWASVVPPGFLFHVKAFGLFPSRAVAPTALPRDLRAAHLPPDLEALPSVRLAQLPPELVDALWERFRSVLRVLHDAGKLGVVVFQFQTTFTPSHDSAAYIAECRRRLGPPFVMGVEFRSRSWYATTPGAVLGVVPEAQLPPHHHHHPLPPLAATPVPSAHHHHHHHHQRDATLYLLRRLGIVNIPSDDIADEFGPHEAKQPYMHDGRLLIADDVTSPLAAVIRVHRRRGDMRVLAPDELADWAARIQRMAASGDGPEAYYGFAGASISGAKLLDGSAPPSSSKMAGGSGGGGEGGDRGEAGAGGAADGGPPAAPRTPAWSGQPARPPPGLETHPYFFTRLRGPVIFLVGTDWEDQPITNLRNIAARVAATSGDAEGGSAAMAASMSSSSLSGSAPRSRAHPVDWKARVAAHDSKHGLAAFFGKSGGLPTAAAAPSPVAAARAEGGASPSLSTKRAREGEEVVVQEEREGEEAPAAAAATAAAAASSASVAVTLDLTGDSASDGEGAAQAPTTRPPMRVAPSPPAATNKKAKGSGGTPSSPAKTLLGYFKKG